MIVDSDTHIMPLDMFDYIDDEFAGLKPKLLFDEEGKFLDVDFPGRWPDVPGSTPLPETRTTGSNYAGMCDIEARLEEYRRMGIDKQLLVTQLLAWSYLTEPRLGAAIAHSHNLATLRLMREYPDQFLGCAMVALQDVEGSIRELQWAAAHDFKVVLVDHTFQVLHHPYGETLGSRRELWPFFQQAEALEIPLFVHNNPHHGHRLVNAMKFQKEALDVLAPFDAHMNLVSFITSGLLDDFPKLKVIHTESGTAWIQPLIEKLDAISERPPVNYTDENPFPRGRRKVQPNARQVVPPEVANEKNREKPSFYFRRNFWFTIETEEPEFPDAIEFLGADRFLFATDYPHDDPGGRMKFNDVELLKVNKRISEGDKELIRAENAKQLFKL